MILRQDWKTDLSPWKNFFGNPDLFISSLTIENLCPPGSQALLNLLDNNIGGVEELRIMTPVSQVLLEASFISRLRVLTFEADSLSLAYMECLATPNSDALSNLQSLKILYISIIECDQPLEGEVLHRITYNLWVLLAKIRSRSLTTFVFRMASPKPKLEPDLGISIFKSIVGFVRAHRQSLRTLLLPTELNFTGLAQENSLRSLEPENDPLELQLTSLLYNNWRGRGDEPTWPRALSLLNWHGLQELTIEANRSFQDVTKNLLGPKVFGTLKYVNLTLRFGPVIDLGVFSACGSLQFLYLLSPSDAQAEAGTLLNFTQLPTSLKIFNLNSIRTFDLQGGLLLEKYVKLISLTVSKVRIPNFGLLLGTIISPMLRLRKLCDFDLGITVQSTDEDQESLRRLTEIRDVLYPLSDQHLNWSSGSMDWEMTPRSVQNLDNLCGFATMKELLEDKYENWENSSKVKPIAIESLNLGELQM